MFPKESKNAPCKMTWKNVSIFLVLNKKRSSIFKIEIDNNGEEIVMTEKIVAFIPNEKLTIFYDAENMLKTNDYIFNEIPNDFFICTYVLLFDSFVSIL